jgi:hypothetical protein
VNKERCAQLGSAVDVVDDILACTAWFALIVLQSLLTSLSAPAGHKQKQKRSPSVSVAGFKKGKEMKESELCDFRSFSHTSLKEYDQWQCRV